MEKNKSKKQEQLEEFLHEEQEKINNENNEGENSTNLQESEKILNENSNEPEMNLAESKTESETETLTLSSENGNENHETNSLKETEFLKEAETLVKDEPKAEVKTFRKNLYSCFFKRFFDILLSGLALILLSPVMLVVAILIRCKMGKGVIFSQYRPGKNNKIFKLYKFRTMLSTKDENGELLPDSQRMTKFGNMLRKTSLDELPQLWNIFKGDMSIIGPRPKLIKDMVFYNEEQNVRALVRPGLTGLAQVNGRNNITWEEIFEYDKEYVKNISLWLDTKIFFKTIINVIKKQDIVEQDKTKQNYYFGDYLLETSQITQEEYDEKKNLAQEIIKKVS